MIAQTFENSCEQEDLQADFFGREVAELAVQALIEEAELTPKPALVDRTSSGAHRDLSLSLLLASAKSLGPYFMQVTKVAQGSMPCVQLREDLGVLGRGAEHTMMRVTGGANAHRGAIWALGLLVAAAAQIATSDVDLVCRRAAQLAALSDRFAPQWQSNGQQAMRLYGAAGAKGEALAGFPHVLYGLTALRRVRQAGASEESAQLDALLSIMTVLEDTCLLHRGGIAALCAAQQGAANVLEHGGSATIGGRKALQRLHKSLMGLWASPGGSADLLAATLFLDHLSLLKDVK